MKFFILLKRFLKGPIFILSLLYFVLIFILSNYGRNPSITTGILDTVKNSITTETVVDLVKKDGYFKFIEFPNEKELGRALKSGRIKSAFTIRDEDGIEFLQDYLVESPLHGVVKEEVYGSYFKIYALKMGMDLVNENSNEYEKLYYKYLEGDSVYSFNILGENTIPNLFPMEALIRIGIIAVSLLYIYDLLKIRDNSTISTRVGKLTIYGPILVSYILGILLLVILKKLTLNIITEFIVMFSVTFLLYMFTERYLKKNAYLVFAVLYILGSITTSGLIVKSQGALIINIVGLIYLGLNSFQKEEV